MAWGALTAIKHAIPALVFVRTHRHLAIATYMVDMHLAIEMQDNAEIQPKHGAAHCGSDHGSDDGDDGYDDDVPNRKRRRWQVLHPVLSNGCAPHHVAEHWGGY